MNNLQRYFNQAGETAQSKFLSADGFAYNYADGFDYTYADGGTDNAVSAGTAGNTSQPYIVILSNTTASDIASQSLFNAFSAIGTSNYGFNAGVSVQMGVANTTYMQLLYQSMNKPFAIGLTYVQASGYGTNTGNPQSQVLEAISLTNRDANGNVTIQPLVPTVDPYQQQSNMIALKFAYVVDGQTALTINQILAYTSVKFYFYPAEDVNLARGLVGRSVNRGFGSPNVVKQDRIVISPNTVQQALNM
jgi:hypothetical protein